MASEDEPNAGAASVASMLRGLRAEALLTQEQLAERSGLSVRTIRNLESARVAAPRGETIRLLADGLGLDPAARRRLERVRQLAVLASTAPDVVRAPAGPFQMPSDTADFVGRGEPQERARRFLLDAAFGAATVPRPIVLTGGPGAGKTTLAVHLAHEQSGAFPDGQLHAELGGAGARPRDPGEVLAEFLRAMGCAGPSIPADTSARAGMYRAMLASRRLLVLLDDAADEPQVRPLLPGTPASGVLITSRGRLAGLGGSHIVEVGVLDRARARRLLTSIIGDERAHEDPAAVEEIVRHCAGLPLALRIAGALLRARPHLALLTLARNLGDEHRRLDTLAFSDLEVRASIRMSEQALPAPHRRALGLLGRLPLWSFTASTAAAALDTVEPTAAEMLDRLVESHLLVGSPAATPNALRYGFHDLVRLYAAELDDDIGVAAALPRVLGHWLALAEVADDALPGTSDVIVRGDAPRRPSDAATIEEVRSAPVDWFTAERRNIVRGIEAAVEGGLPGYAWELAGAIRTFAALRSDWDLWQHTHEVALRACRATGETRGAGSMLVGLGKLKIDRHVVADGPPPELGSALELFSRIGETAGEAQALLELASFHELAGALRGSVQYAERAARTAGVAGNAGLQADASYVHGRALRRDGDNVRAEQVLTRALRGYRQLRKARGEAQATWELAAVRRDADDLAGAETLLDSCLAQLRRIGDRRGQARVLIDLALTRTRLRRYEEAESCLDEAVRLCRVLGERSFLAHAHDAHAQLLLDRGRPSEAADPAAAAQEIWAELGDSTRKQASGELLAAAGPSIPEQDVPGIS